VNKKEREKMWQAAHDVLGMWPSGRNDPRILHVFDDLQTDHESLVERVEVLELRNQALSAVANRWWWRTPTTGTVCVVCGAAVHFDLGIDDILHHKGCAVVELRSLPPYPPKESEEL
jgi:hypothetical protein